MTTNDFVTRDELAHAVESLRAEIAGLGALRADLGALRADLNILRADLNAAVAALGQRMDGLERTQNRMLLVFGTLLVFLVALQLFVLLRAGL
jgi:hypothetical protein